MSPLTSVAAEYAGKAASMDEDETASAIAAHEVNSTATAIAQRASRIIEKNAAATAKENSRGRRHTRSLASHSKGLFPLLDEFAAFCRFKKFEKVRADWYRLDGIAQLPAEAS